MNNNGNLVPHTNQNSSLTGYIQGVLQNAETDSYQAEISRENRVAFIYMIDQSGSMDTPFDQNRSKAEVVADWINAFLEELINRCEREIFKDYFDVLLIGYGQDSQAQVLWSGALSGKDFVSVASLKQFLQDFKRPVEKEVNVRGQIVKTTVDKPFWIDPIADGSTPMRAALELAIAHLEPWIQQHPASYPPTVINITDGHATDGTPEELILTANRLKRLVTSDGATLFYNCHIAGGGQKSLIFPSSKQELPQDDLYAEMLYEMSSRLPLCQHQLVQQELGEKIAANYRCMGYNTSVIELFKLMDIGSRVTRRV